MLWIKSLHIVLIASWFAGLFYLPRIFVNLAMEKDPAAIARLLLMARKLFRFMTFIAVPALACGLWLWLVVGIGAGQMSRVDSARIAAWKAGEATRAAGASDLLTKGSVVASDAFFPFADGLIAAAEAGVTAVIQPGGSMRDDEVIAEANARGLAMVFTGMRHFRH